MGGTWNTVLLWPGAGFGALADAELRGDVHEAVNWNVQSLGGIGAP